MTVRLDVLPLPEILRYMGCPPEQADPATRRAAEQAAGEICAAARPRWTWRCFALTRSEAGVVLDCGLLLPGRDLAAHLQACTRAVVLAVTLGTGADACIRRSGSDLLRTLALDCAASAAVEEVCEAAEAALHEAFPGAFFTWRYSPGYGDLPISLQGKLLELLDAQRRIGLTVSPSGILLPRKSVTAVLGLADRPPAPSSRSCRTCPGREGCLYRRSGGHCATA